MKKKIDHDIYVGIFLLIVAVLGYFLTIGLPKGSDMFPRLLFVLLGFLSLPILFKSIKRSKDSESKNMSYFTFEEIKLPLMSYLIVILYAILIRFIGFFIATTVFIPSFMVFYRNKSIKHMLITIVGVTVFAYFLFVKQLNVQFPTGLLF